MKRGLEIVPEGYTAELKVTGDGSHTLYIPSLNEHYHSVFGAIRESKHIFIDAGLRALPSDLPAIEILEIGFGTGLNALLTCLETQDRAPLIRYSVVEKWPLPPEMTSLLNYPDQLNYAGAADIFHRIHAAEWGDWTEINSCFNLKKIQADLLGFFPDKDAFILIYFDAFGPDVQPEMWTEEVFSKLFYALKPGGILVTYSTKGTVKRNLKGAGFTIEKLPGPPGKREILRAVKPVL
jgi:tRNA U34 5-methylaminomethyl-2-thiouridine-forming methyltransferase MnmC